MMVLTRVVFGDEGRFPFNPKFQKFRLVRHIERTISVWSDRNIPDQLERCPFWPFRSFRSVGPKCPFPFDTIVVPRTALLYPTYKNNNQTRGFLGRVCVTGMYRSVGHVKFPKCQIGIFVEWKAPEIMWCDLPLKRISFAVWLVTLAPIQIFWYFAPSSMSFSGSFYVSVKLPTYPSPKPKFCPK